MELCAKVISFGVWCTSQLSSALPLPLKVVNQRNDSLILPGSLEHSWRLPVESFLWACGLKSRAPDARGFATSTSLEKDFLGGASGFLRVPIRSSLGCVQFCSSIISKTGCSPGPLRTGLGSWRKMSVARMSLMHLPSPRLEGRCCFMASRHPAWVNQSFGAQAHGKCV